MRRTTCLMCSNGGSIATPPNARDHVPPRAFCIPKVDIVDKGYDLSLNRYKEVVHEQIEHRAPMEIVAGLAAIEAEIQRGIEELKEMLK